MIPAEVPADAHQRAIAVEHLESNLFVDAGAGSGKTSVLVDRVVGLIRSGVDIGQIAAITFTEAAAAELRQRIRVALHHAAGEGQIHHDVLDRFDSAAITTLHAFALGILKEHWDDAGLPFAVELADPLESEASFEQRRLEIIGGWYDDPQCVLARQILDVFAKNEPFKTTPTKVDSVVRLVRDQWYRFRQCDVEVGELLPSPDAGASMISALESALALRDACVDSSDRLAQHLGGVVAPTVMAFRDSQEPLERAGALAFKLSSTGGKAPNWQKRKPEVVAALADGEQARVVLATEMIQRCILTLALSASKQVVADAQDRAARGVLEFHDLLVLCRDLLLRNGRVRDAISAKYNVMLLDEFQDTDPLQLEIARLICSASDPNGTRARDGSLFVVGDPKQSIYRFRGADVGAYLAAKSAGGHTEVELSTNFRSVPGIIEWTNAVFGELMRGETQVEFQPLVAARRATQSLRPAVLLIGDVEPGSRADEVRRIACNDIARQFHEMVADQWPVLDKACGEVRDIHYGDMCVLIPSRTVLAALVDAFDRYQIPLRIETASLMWSTPVICELVSLLRAIANPADQISLVATLRSGVFGCSDADLLAWRSGGSTGSPGSAYVADAIAQIHRWHDTAVGERADRVVDFALTQGRFFERMALRQRHRDEWRRLRYVRSAAEQYCAERSPGLVDFLSWIDLASSELVRAPEPILDEPDDRAVRVMTIHGSKGLEFGAVAIVGFASKGSNQRGVSVRWDDTAGGPMPTFSFNAGGEPNASVPFDELLDDDEKVRLAYVAATRARDWLVVSLARSETKGVKALAERISDASRSRDDSGALRLSSVDLPDRSIGAPRTATTERLEHAVVQAQSQIDRQRRSFRPKRSVWSATGVNVAVRAEQAKTADDLEPDHPSLTHGDTRGRGAAFGSAVHQVLEVLQPGDSSERVELMCQNACVDFGLVGEADNADRSHGSAGPTGLAVPGGPRGPIGPIGPDERDDGAIERDVVETVKSACSDERLLSHWGRRHWRELFVCGELEGQVVEGFIDLMSQDEHGRLHIVDFKTDAVATDEDLEVLVGRYGAQQMTYALVVARLLDLEVASMSLCCLTPGAVRWVEVAMTEQLESSVRGALRAEPVSWQ